MPSQFTLDVIKIIHHIPVGKVLTYGKIAKLAGNPRAARQVSWLLHSSTKKYNLPWHRVINSQGKIALKSQDGKDYQKKLLEIHSQCFGEIDLMLWLRIEMRALD